LLSLVVVEVEELLAEVVLVGSAQEQDLQLLLARVTP